MSKAQAAIVAMRAVCRENTNDCESAARIKRQDVSCTNARGTVCFDVAKTERLVIEAWRILEAIEYRNRSIIFCRSSDRIEQLWITEYKRRILLWLDDVQASAEVIFEYVDARMDAAAIKPERTVRANGAVEDVHVLPITNRAVKPVAPRDFQPAAVINRKLRLSELRPSASTDSLAKRRNDCNVIF